MRGPEICGVHGTGGKARPLGKRHADLRTSPTLFCSRGRPTSGGGSVLNRALRVEGPMDRGRRQVAQRCPWDPKALGRLLANPRRG